ncbi:hypothetical protein [Halostella litorea]|uniref:hypothetical protein n=1 Tax=Halostella litorea TaxID=2528831 RepID=UPI001F381AB9|nr:hypothetical protein [Halostella litorea]
MTLRNSIDPLRIALGVFIVLGIVMTGVGGYAVLSTTGSVAGLEFSASAASAAVTGLALVVVAVALSREFSHRRPGQDR